MLNGLDPIIIFQFSKLIPDISGLSIPVISAIPSVLEQPPIPLYLSEAITGIFIDSEDKNVDIETDVQTKTDGSDADISQKGIASTVSISLQAKKDSIGITLLSAFIDTIFDKVTSKEYSISYLHGAITVFRGVLHSYSVNQNADNDLLNIKIELSRGTKNPVKPDVTPQVPALTDAQVL